MRTTLEHELLVFQDAAAAVGNGNSKDVNGFGGVLARVTIATTATVTFEATVLDDDTDMVAVQAVNLSTGEVSTTATASGLYAVVCPGAKRFRARISAWTAGAVTVKGNGVPPGLFADLLRDVQLSAQNVNVGDVDVASIAAGETHIGEVGGRLASVAATEITRPADTTAYAAKDVIGPAAGAAFGTLTNVARVNGGSGFIVGLRLVTDNEAFLPRIRVWLYRSTTGLTAVADNAAFGVLYAEKEERIGYIDLPALAVEDTTAGNSASAINFDVMVPFICESTSRDLYFQLETLDAATPASGQKFWLEAFADLN